MIVLLKLQGILLYYSNNLYVPGLLTKPSKSVFGKCDKDYLTWIPQCQDKQREK